MVNIVIPTFNGLRWLQPLYDALKETISPEIETMITLVDDGSTDATEAWALKHPEINYVRQIANMGFAKACNAGARSMKSDYVLFLNNDTLPLKGFLEEMLKVIEAPPYPMIVGAKLLFPDRKRVEHGGLGFTAAGFPFDIYRGRNRRDPNVIRTRPIDAVTAACMLVKRDLFNRLGGFHEGFINGWEDSDFCLRAKQMGSQIFYCADAEVVHFLYGSDSEGRFFHEKDNKLLYQERWIHHRQVNIIAPFWMAIAATWDCNLKCKHCSIWQGNNKRRFPEEIDTVGFQTFSAHDFYSNIINVAIFGGEPTLHSKLVDLLAICATRWPGQEIGIITNGSHPHTNQKQIWETVKNNLRGHFVVRVSIDGREKIHDELRGAKGSFNDAIETAKIVNTLWPGVGGISITVYPDTIDELPYLIDFIGKLGIKFCIRAGVTGSYFDSKSDEKWSQEQIEKLREIIIGTSSSLFVFDRFAKMLPDYLETGEHKQCEAFRKTLVVNTDLMVSACHELPPMGHLRDIPNIWGRTKEWCQAGADCLAGKCFKRSCVIDGPYSTSYIMD